MMMSWNRYSGHSGRFSNGETPAILYLSLFAITTDGDGYNFSNNKPPENISQIKGLKSQLLCLVSLLGSTSIRCQRNPTPALNQHLTLLPHCNDHGRVSRAAHNMFYL